MALSGKDLRKIAEYFNGKPVLRAFVFGSYARGEANEQSDIDLLVELDYSQPIGLLSFMQMQDELCALLGRPVDLVSSRGLSPHIGPRIQVEKQVVYEREAA
jgi:predicted nucleotidyltransferase